MNDHLRYKVGLSKPERQLIMQDIYGDNGIINANDTFVYEQRTNILLEKVSIICHDFLPYLKTRVILLLKERVVNVV